MGPMKFDDIPTSCCLVKAVHVLRDQDKIMKSFFPAGQNKMTGMGIAGSDHPAPPVIPFPDKARVAAEGFGCRQLLGSKLFPQPGLAAERGNPGFGRNAGACKDGKTWLVAKKLR